MDIIFLRHGEAVVAEGPDPAADARRSLTDEGCNLLRSSLPGLLAVLKKPDKVTVWSSPLDRAMQTAQILAEILGQDPSAIVSQDCLRDGDYAAFSQLLSRQSPKACLVLVGHEPYLSQWSQQLCACSLPFKKGAMAGFKVEADSMAAGSLQWFMQPRTLQRLAERFGSESEPDKTRAASGMDDKQAGKTGKKHKKHKKHHHEQAENQKQAADDQVQVSENQRQAAANSDKSAGARRRTAENSRKSAIRNKNRTETAPDTVTDLHQGETVL